MTDNPIRTRSSLDEVLDAHFAALDAAAAAERARRRDAARGTARAPRPRVSLDDVLDAHFDGLDGKGAA